MKTLIPLILLALTFSACKSELGESADAAAASDNTITSSAAGRATSEEPVAAAEIVGSYVGKFGDNKITLLISKADNGSISGRTIVGGNDRPFEGTIVFENGVYKVLAKEPGDHKDDGMFTFSIAKANLNEASGTWKANDTKRPEKSYNLNRKSFEYRTNVGNWPEASQRLLKAEDVENLPKDELEFMRNEIFARHGYCFNKKHLRQQFENEDWYIPNTTDIKGYLTDIEKKNIALIKRYEKYAEEYGDEFGR